MFTRFLIMHGLISYLPLEGNASFSSRFTNRQAFLSDQDGCLRSRGWTSPVSRRLCQRCPIFEKLLDWPGKKASMNLEPQLQVEDEAGRGHGRGRTRSMAEATEQERPASKLDKPRWRSGWESGG